MHGAELPAKAADGIERGFVRLFAALAAMSWIGMVLAELGWFRLIPLAALAVLGMAVGGLLLERALRQQASRALHPGEFLYVLVLAAVAGAVVLPPGDPVVGGADESVYLSIASSLRHHGALVTPDTLLAETPREDWPRLFSRDRFWPQRLNRFDGGVQIVEGSPVLQPSFFHLLPVWIAGTELVGGDRAGRLVAPVFAVLSAIALYLAGRRLASPVAAAAAAALLATSLGQAWCGRLPLSELPAQFFVLSGVWLTAWWNDTDSAVPGVLAGVAFGLAAFSRVDVLILVIPAVVIVLGARWWQRGADGALVGYALALALVSAHAAAHAFTVAQSYTLRIGRHLVHDRTLPAFLAGAAALVFLGALLAVGQRRHWRLIALGRYVGPAIAVSTIGVVGLQPDRLFESPLGYLLTLVGVAIAGVGLLRWSCGDDAAAWLVVLLTAASALAYLDGPRDLPDMPGVFRRTLPVLLPLGALLLADTLAPRQARRLRTIAGAIVLAIVIASGARHVRPILGHTIVSGARDAIDAIARDVPASGVVLVDRSLPSHLALAVDFLLARSAVAADFGLAHGPGEGTAALTRLMTRAARHGNEVLFLTAAEDPRAPWLPDALPGGWTPYLLRDVVLAYDTLEGRRQGWPSRIERVRQPVSLYRLLPPERRASLPLRVEVGGTDLALSQTGWLPPELMLSARGRWTHASGDVRLPAAVCDAATPLFLTLRAASLRPPTVPQPRVTLRIDAVTVGEVVPADSAFHVYALDLPPPAVSRVCSAATTLTIVTGTFVPARDAGSPDSRELGLAVDWLEITPDAVHAKRE